MMTALDIAAQAGTVLLVLIFARAAWHKGTDLPRTAATVAAYGILPERLIHPIVRLLFAAELVVAAGLIVATTRPVAAMIAVGLLVGYAIAMARVLLTGRDRVDCGCGGAPQMISWLLVARNIALTAMALLLLAPTENGGMVEAGLALLAGLTAWAVLGTAEALGANHRHALQTERRK